MRRRLPVTAAVLLVVVAAGYLAGRLAGGADDEAKLGPPPPGNAASTTVTRVVDGDTVVLASVGKARLIGVDTPEVFGGEQCFGARASAFTKRELGKGQDVRYAVGAERRDRYGRLLVYLWLPDGRSFNALLLRDGYARTLTIAPNDRYAPAFDALATRARTEHRGLWATCS